MKKKHLPPSLDEIYQSVREQVKSLAPIPDKPVLVYTRSTGEELRPIEMLILGTVEKHPGLLRVEIEKTLGLKKRITGILTSFQVKGLIRKEPVTVFINGKRARSYGYYLSGNKPSST